MADLDQITADSMVTNEELLRDFLATAMPDLDTAPGSTLSELLIRPAASLYSQQEIDLLALLQQYSLPLLAASASPDADMADNLAANFKVYRRTGLVASGYLAIYADSDSSANVYINAGTVFNVGAVQVQNLQTYVGVATDAVGTAPGAIYRKMILTGGYYMFTIPVTTLTETTATLDIGTAATPVVAHSRIQSAKVASPITGGQGEETTADLVARVPSAITAKVPSGEAHITAMLEDGEFNALSVAVFGLSDPEMLRDRDNVTGISSGARVDAYVRTATLPEEAELVVAGTRVVGDLWGITIPAEDLDGFYRVKSVQASGGPEVLASDLTITYAMSNDGDYPYLSQVDHVFYSVFITVLIELDYPDLVGDSVDFTIKVEQMGDLRAIQDYMSSLPIRNRAQDLLIKAPVPCFLSIEMSVNLEGTSGTIDLDEVKAAVAEAMNDLPIGRGLVSASDIAYVIKSQFPGYILDLPIRMEGTNVMPDGSIVTTPSVDGELKAPVDEDLGVSARNTAFFCRTTDISVAANDRLM